MTNRALTDGFFQNILSNFLDILSNFGLVLGSIIFSIIGLIGFEIWNKYYGDEESYFKQFSYKKVKKPYEYLFIPVIFYLFGILYGIVGIVGLTFIAFIIDLITIILYALLGKLVNY